MEEAKQSKKSNTPVFIIGVVVIVGLALFGIYTVKNQQSQPNVQQVQQTSPTNVKESQTVPQAPIKDLVQLQMPSGWTEKADSGEYQLLSPDLVPGTSGGPETNAVIITFEVKSNQSQDALDEVYQNVNDDIANPLGVISRDLTITTVAGLPAISYYSDYDGYLHTYVVQHGTDLWTITITSPLAKYEDQYKEAINAVLSSIQLTQ